MFVPFLLPGIEKRHQKTCHGVDSCQVGALLEAAVPPCERKVVRSGQPTMLPRNDVLNVERTPECRLRQTAIFTPIGCASPDLPGSLAYACGSRAWRAFDCQ